MSGKVLEGLESMIWIQQAVFVNSSPPPFCASRRHDRMHHNLIVEAMQREEGEEAKHTAAAWMEDIIDAFGLWRVLMLGCMMNQNGRTSC